MLGVVFMDEMKKISKKALYEKIEYYAKEITSKRPTFDTVFRQYYDSMKIISDILYHIRENPWHPENDYAFEIFETIDEKLQELEKIRLQAVA